MLAPCPFCGGTRVRYEHVTYAHDLGEDDHTLVECITCSAQGPLGHDEESAAERWNERHPDFHPDHH